MTGYTEEFAKIWGGGTRLGKGRKKGRQRRKTTAQSRLHSQGSRGCHSCHRKTMVLCFESPLQLSLDTGCPAWPSTFWVQFTFQHISLAGCGETAGGSTVAETDASEVRPPESRSLCVPAMSLHKPLNLSKSQFPQ